jgi:hypothetical protein
MSWVILAALLLGGNEREIQQTPTDVDAVVWAFEALATIDSKQQPFIRFVWIPPWGTAEWIGLMDFTINSVISQSRTLYRGVQYQGGWLLAYDLSLYAEGQELATLIKLWDELALKDPYFHVPNTNVIEIDCTTCGADGRIRTSRGTVDCSTCKGTGKRSNQSAKVAILAPHLDAALAKNVSNVGNDERVDVLVTQLTSSTGAIYRADWLFEQLWSTTRGGYTEFRQQLVQAEGGLSQFETLLKKRGYDLQTALDIGGEKGAYLIKSGVTGKNRVILAFYGAGSRSPVVVTYDPADARTRPDEQFIQNLIDIFPFSDASEAFIPLQNGMIEDVLTDGNGNIQRVAPDVIVSDHTKPFGYTSILESGMSCIVCHLPDNGYKTAKNDMKYMFGANVDFFGEDLSFTRKGKQFSFSKQEVIDILVNRYAERIDEPDGVLGRARRDYLRALDQVTDYAIGDKTAAQRLGELSIKTYHDYFYGMVDAQVALKELGFVVSKEEAPQVFSQVVPPLPVGEIEHVLLDWLRQGAEIKRIDWEALYVEAARRAAVYRATLGAKQ